MIRVATLADLPAVVELGKKFLESTILNPIAAYDPGSAWETARDLIESENGEVFVLEKDKQIIGFISGILAPVYWNFSILAAQQLAFYVLPEHRGFSSLKLLKQWELWASGKGATVFYSGAKRDVRFGKMDKMLDRMGYVELETVHVKGTAKP